MYRIRNPLCVNQVRGTDTTDPLLGAPRRPPMTLSAIDYANGMHDTYRKLADELKHARRAKHFTREFRSSFRLVAACLLMALLDAGCGGSDVGDDVAVSGLPQQIERSLRVDVPTE